MCGDDGEWGENVCVMFRLGGIGCVYYGCEVGLGGGGGIERGGEGGVCESGGG